MATRPPQAIMVNPTAGALIRLEAELAVLESANRAVRASGGFAHADARAIVMLFDAVGKVLAAYRDYRLTL